MTFPKKAISTIAFMYLYINTVVIVQTLKHKFITLCKCRVTSVTSFIGVPHSIIDPQ